MDYISSVRIKGGYLDGTEAAFGPGLNCVVGPRGAGKSTLLNAVAFAADGPGDLFVGQNGREEVIVEIEWTLAGGGTGRTARSTASGWLKARPGLELSFYPQSALSSVLESPSILVELLDARRPEAKELRKRLDSSLRQVRSLQRQFEEMGERWVELADQAAQGQLLREELACLSSGRLEAAGLKQEEIFRDVETMCALSRSASRLRCSMDFVWEAPGRAGEACPAVEEARAVYAELVETVRELAGSARTEAEKACAAMEELGRRFEGEKAEAEDDIRRILEESGFSDRDEYEDRRRMLVRQAEELLGAEVEACELRVALDRLAWERDSLAEEAGKMEEELRLLRREAAADLNRVAGGFRLALESHRDVERMEALLKLIIPLPGVARRLAARMEGFRLYRAAMEGRFEEFSAAAGLAPEEALAAASALAASPLTGRLLEICDRPVAEVWRFRGSGWERTVRSSPGVNCSLVMPFVLAGTRGMLLVDQPEDNLDAAYIYSAVAGMLERVGKNRQCIIVTHNPNIILGARAQMVVFMEGSPIRGKVAWRGGLDETETAARLQELVEGGAECFNLRAEYYRRAGYKGEGAVEEEKA